VAPCAAGGAPFALFLSGWVLPEEGPLPTAKGGAGLGRRVEALPLTRIAFPAERAPGAPGAITLGTAAAIYTAVKPAAAYKKIFAAAEATAATAREALRALAGDAGGEGANPGIDLKEVRYEGVIDNTHARACRVWSDRRDAYALPSLCLLCFFLCAQMCARIARANGSSLSAARDALLRDGAYVLERIAAHDVAHAAAADSKGKGKAAAPLALAASAFAVALRAEMASAAAGARTLGGSAPGGGIVIRDTSAAADASGEPTSTSAAQMSADEALARSMMDADRAKETAKARKAVARAAAAAAGGEAYIKIDESEFADFYPAPAPYEKEEEEMDELLMGGAWNACALCACLDACALCA
jgi:hypothetical protein